MKIERKEVVKLTLDDMEIEWLRRAINIIPKKNVVAVLGNEARQFLDNLWENL